MKRIITGIILLLISQQLNSQSRTMEVFLSLTRDASDQGIFSYSNNVSQLNVSDKDPKITDDIKNVPSVVVRENTGNFGLSLPSIRGFSSNQSVIVYDDIKLPKDITSTYDLSILPTIGIDKLYVLKGGWSAVFGSNAEGGVISLKTDDLKKDNSIEYGSEFGAYETKRYFFKTFVSKERTNLMVAGENFYSNGFQENSKANKNSISLKSAYDFNEFGKTTINIFAVRLKRGLPSGTPFDISAFNGEREKKANSTTDWQEDTNLFLNLKHNFNVGDFNNEISYSRNNLLRQAYQFGNTTDINTYSNNFIAKTKIKGYNLGLEIEETYLKSNDYGNHNIKSIGYFANRDFELSDRFSTSLYLRWDDNKKYDDMLSPKCSLKYYALESLLVSYSIGRSYKAPNFVDVYGASNWWWDPNPEIKPEKSVSNEVSISYKSLIDFNITGYYYDISDKITFITDNNTWHSKSVNMAKGYIKGVEFSAQSREYKGFKVGVGANLMDVRGKDKASGIYTYKKLAYSPDYKLVFNIGYRRDFVNINFNTEKVSKQYTQIDKKGKVIPEYTVSNISLSAGIDPLSIFVMVENIFNERYATTADSFNGYYPANPRNLMAGFSLKF